MVPAQLIEKIAKHEDMRKDELIKESLNAYLLEKKRECLNEKFEIFSKYNVSSLIELKKAIKIGKVAEHPAWEDLIEAKNIDTEIKGIESDIRSIKKA